MCVLGLYIISVKLSGDDEDKRNIHLLFVLGVSGTVFLAFLSVKSHHYTSLYHRYHSFGLPYSCLFAAYATGTIVKNTSVSKYMKIGVVLFFLLPAVALYAVVVKNHDPARVYNHSVVAEQIVSNSITRLGVPTWTDAFMVSSFLPAGYKIDYVRNETVPYFTFERSGREETMPVLNTSNK